MRQLLPIPNYRDGMTSVFDRMMRRLENEANDKKRLEKQYSTSLRGTEAEKQMIEIRLRSKDKELNRINESFYGNRVITSYFIIWQIEIKYLFFFQGQNLYIEKRKSVIGTQIGEWSNEYKSLTSPSGQSQIDDTRTFAKYRSPSKWTFEKCSKHNASTIFKFIQRSVNRKEWFDL